MRLSATFYSPRLPRRITAVMLLLFVFGVSDPVSALQFSKVVPFTTADSLRIDTEIISEARTEATVIAQINNSKTGQRLWGGPLGQVEVRPGTTAAFSRRLKLAPELWSPAHPLLYDLIVKLETNGAVAASFSARIGFRSFETKGGRFLFNGKPLFLRGTAINPPGRTISPEVGETRVFAESYIRFLKSRNVNIVRLARDSQVWFDVCDELGMLVFQGRYGAPVNGSSSSPPKDLEASIRTYKDQFATYAAHPSIVIYVLANEMPYTGRAGIAYHEYLTKVHRTLEQWDPTRLYIGNAGYGEGREGDICDVHRYWGWYYNSFLSYYHLRERYFFGQWWKHQPITFSECVGAFSSSYGEFNLIINRQMGAQLNWTGHSGNQPEDAERYQSFLVKEATESFRRMRPINSRLSGIMPFSIFFYNWSGISSFEQMKPKPALEQLAVSYQPVLLSWELWQRQVYAGASIRPIAHIINDSDSQWELQDATLKYQLCDPDGHQWIGAELELGNIGYYHTARWPIELRLPGNLPTGNYRLSGKVIAGGTVVSSNEISFFIAGYGWNKRPGTNTTVLLYDPKGATARALAKLSIRFDPVRDLAKLTGGSHTLVLAENGWDHRLAAKSKLLENFVANGGRVLCLQQQANKFKTSWLPEPVSLFSNPVTDPAYLPRKRPFKENMFINPERLDHPVFEGLDRRKLEIWSDYTDWDQTKHGFPQVFPVTAGFRLLHTESLARTAVIANYDRGLEGIALAELFSGKGSVILSGFDLVNRVGMDPVADRLLCNLISYAASSGTHNVYPLVDGPVSWGNYASERGLITGPLHGFVLHSGWKAPPTNPQATPLGPNQGEWSLKPGDPFVAAGRRAVGPFGYSTGTSFKQADPATTTGTAKFWARIPKRNGLLVTKVRNPTGEVAYLTVVVNGVAILEQAEVQNGKTEVFTSSFGSAENVEVEYTASKSLIFLETSFE